MLPNGGTDTVLAGIYYLDIEIDYWLKGTVQRDFNYVF
jgi:hypothetical protein